MDELRFDDVARRLGQGITRRRAMKGLAAGALAAFAGRGVQDASAQQCGDCNPPPPTTCPESRAAFRAEVRAELRAIRSLPPRERRAAVRSLAQRIREVAQNC